MRKPPVAAGLRSRPDPERIAMDFAFALSTLDRAGESRQDNDWLQRRLDARGASALVLSDDGRVLVALPERTLLSLPLMLLRDRFEPLRFSFLGDDEDRAVFALTLDAPALVEFTREFNAE